MYDFDYIRLHHIDIINDLAPKKNRTKSENDLFVRAIRMEELIYEAQSEREAEGYND